MQLEYQYSGAIFLFGVGVSLSLLDNGVRGKILPFINIATHSGIEIGLLIRNATYICEYDRRHSTGIIEAFILCLYASPSSKLA
jgi:hypothetical protein